MRHVQHAPPRPSPPGPPARKRTALTPSYAPPPPTPPWLHRLAPIDLLSAPCNLRAYGIYGASNSPLCPRRLDRFTSLVDGRNSSRKRREQAAAAAARFGVETALATAAYFAWVAWQEGWGQG